MSVKQNFGSLKRAFSTLFGKYFKEQIDHDTSDWLDVIRKTLKKEFIVKKIFMI